MHMPSACPNLASLSLLARDRQQWSVSGKKNRRLESGEKHVSILSPFVPFVFLFCVTITFTLQKSFKKWYMNAIFMTDPDGKWATWVLILSPLSLWDPGLCTSLSSSSAPGSFFLAAPFLLVVGSTFGETWCKVSQGEVFSQERSKVPKDCWSNYREFRDFPITEGAEGGVWVVGRLGKRQKILTPFCLSF